jgi:hypothetical protein
MLRNNTRKATSRFSTNDGCTRNGTSQVIRKELQTETGAGMVGFAFSSVVVPGKEKHVIKEEEIIVTAAVTIKQMNDQRERERE